MFAGLMSRWISPCLCAYNPLHTCKIIPNFSATAIGRPDPIMASSVTLEIFHDEIRHPILVSQFVHGHNILVMKTAGILRLAIKPDQRSGSSAAAVKI